MTWQDPHALARRARVGQLIVLATFAVLALAFFRVQVLTSARYELQSTENRRRAVALPAPRGLVTDRNGVVLAENVPGYAVALRASSPESLKATITRLTPIMTVDSARLEGVLRRYRRAPTEPVVILRDASFETVSALEERRVWVPGLIIQSEPKRRYPFGEVTAHFVGYVGEVTEEELRSDAFPGARAGTLAGRHGIERQYDHVLRGKDGFKFIEVDALGRTVRAATEKSTLEPQPGATIRTTVDIDLQEHVARVFPEGWRGAVVAIDPKSGGILALYSSPTYDPNVFIGGVDPAFWAQLSEAADNPLFNRVTQARYPPASPWKLVMAAMALQRGIVTMESKMSLSCTGGMRYFNRYFRCWRVSGHGELTLAEAIQHSCDVYFYQLGIKLGLNNLLHDAVELGFYERSGVDLPNESRPVFPPSTEYYNQRYGPRGWTNAVTLNLAIGQGENAQTLIGMVQFYAMLANPDGVTPQPRLVAHETPTARQLDLSDDQLAGLREALIAVVAEGTGAAARLSKLRVAGKTGTAQNPHGPDHGWFIGFAPADDPEIVVGAIVEFAEHGSSVAPMVSSVIAQYLLGASPSIPAGDYRFLMPADSAPEPVPLLPDTALLRPGARISTPAPDTTRGAASRIR